MIDLQFDKYGIVVLDDGAESQGLFEHIFNIASGDTKSIDNILKEIQLMQKTIRKSLEDTFLSKYIFSSFVLGFYINFLDTTSDEQKEILQKETGYSFEHFIKSVCMGTSKNFSVNSNAYAEQAVGFTVSQMLSAQVNHLTEDAINKFKEIFSYCYRDAESMSFRFYGIRTDKYGVCEMGFYIENVMEAFNYFPYLFESMKEEIVKASDGNLSEFITEYIKNDYVPVDIDPVEIVHDPYNISVYDYDNSLSAFNDFINNGLDLEG